MPKASFLKLLRFLVALEKTNLKAALALRGTFLLQVLFMALNNLIYFSFWWMLLRRIPHIGGWRVGDIAGLYAVVAAGFGLAVTFAGGVRHLGRMIEEGELDGLLTQPKPVLLHALGSRSQASGIGDLMSGCVLLGLFGQVRIGDAPFVVIAVLASAAVFLATGIIFFSAAFWFGKTEMASRQLWDVLITFALYPEPLFGGALRLLLFTLLPAGFVGYVPAAVIREPSLTNVALALSSSFGYLALASWLFARGLRRYASGSRFGVFG
jgi:ABC-2 type transport system permease protein